ncbi:MAG: sulfite exporter TauE/SafE family protein [Rhodocyclaceae bacterium]
MPDTGYTAVFLIGLLGGTHCVAMCGGIVSALTLQSPGSRPQWNLHLAYNVGRLSSYVLAGAALGAIGGGMGEVLQDWLPVQWLLYVFANLMLLALGLYLAGATWSLAFTERLGQKIWARLQPLSRRWLPARTVAQALPLGLLWGFLPCGMVYSALAVALVSGGAWRGASLMLAFGLGTLPNLLLAAALLTRLRGFCARPAVRLAAGLLVIAFGVFGLINTATLGGQIWQGVHTHD